MGLLGEIVVVEAAVAAAAVTAAAPAAPVAPPVADPLPLADPAADHRSKSGSKTAPVPASAPVVVSAVSHPIWPPPHERARPATETTAVASRSPDPAVKARGSARRACWREEQARESAWKSRRRGEILLPCCVCRGIVDLEMWSGWKVSLLGHGRTARPVVGVGRDEIGGARGPR